MPNLCGVNQKLLSEVLDKVKKGQFNFNKWILTNTLNMFNDVAVQNSDKKTVYLLLWLFNIIPIALF